MFDWLFGNVTKLAEQLKQVQVVLANITKLVDFLLKTIILLERENEVLKTLAKQNGMVMPYMSSVITDDELQALKEKLLK